MRDPHLDRALAAATRRGRAGGACPDATILAAYADGSLTADERADLELHAADCPTCVETLAILSSLDTSEPARTTRRWWVLSPVTRWTWLVPVATAVLVVAVWMRTEGPTGTTATAPAQRLPQSAAAGVADSVDRLERPDVLKSEQALQSARRKATATPERRDERLAARAAPPVLVPPGGASAGMLEDKDAKKEADMGAANRPADVPALSASANRLPRRSRCPLPRRPPPGAAKADTFARVNENMVAGAAKTARASADEHLMKQMAAPLILEVPATAIRVRVANDRIERSLDGGTTWALEWPGPLGVVRVGTCPTTDVCWLGGEAGAVLARSADGKWTARGIPGVASPVVAFASVTAATATATLADGRQFSTSDGGVHWQAIPTHP